MTKTLSVAAINKGTVIDHIRAGQAFPILHLLRLVDKNMVTVGLNLQSKRLGGLKDLIKIANRLLTDEEANDIVVLAPEVTINIVENFEVVKKINTRLPESIKDVFVCPNLACITHSEPVQSIFKLEDQGKILKLICHYCERTYDRDDVKLKM